MEKEDWTASNGKDMGKNDGKKVKESFYWRRSMENLQAPITGMTRRNTGENFPKKMRDKNQEEEEMRREKGLTRV